MKKAVLVIGCSERDINEAATQIQIHREDDTGKIWRVVSEKKILEDYVKTHNYHSLCLAEWLAPIKNPVIVDLLTKTEKEIDNVFSMGVIVCGQFALDPEVREAYLDVLTSQGYEVELYPVMTTWTSLLTESLITRSPLRDALKNWRLFTKQFSRQYAPLSNDQKLAVVVPPEIATEKNIPGTFEIVVMLEALQSRGYAIVVLNSSSDIEKTKQAFKQIGFPDAIVLASSNPNWNTALAEYKLDLFWTAVANYYDVRLVIEHNAEIIDKWRDIGLPVISLTNIYDVGDL